MTLKIKINNNSFFLMFIYEILSQHERKNRILKTKIIRLLNF